jgi:hypothetical protein
MQRKGKRRGRRQKAKGKQLMPSFAFGCSNAKAKGAHFFFACKGKSRPTHNAREAKDEKAKVAQRISKGPLLGRCGHKGKRGALFICNLCFWLCTFACDYPLLVTTARDERG